MRTKPVTGILKKASENVAQTTQENAAKSMMSQANNACGFYSNVALKAMEILGNGVTSMANLNKIR